MRTVIVACLIIAGFLSCKSQQDDSLTFSEEFLLQVVEDPLYTAYQETIHQDAENVILKIYDMEGIGQVFDELPFGTNICLSEEARQKFSRLAGGDIYLANECKRLELIQQLDRKYQYSSFPEEVSQKLVYLYRDINAAELKQRAYDLYYKKN